MSFIIRSITSALSQSSARSLSSRPREGFWDVVTLHGRLFSSSSFIDSLALSPSVSSDHTAITPLLSSCSRSFFVFSSGLSLIPFLPIFQCSRNVTRCSLSFASCLLFAHNPAFKPADPKETPAFGEGVLFQHLCQLSTQAPSPQKQRWKQPQTSPLNPLPSRVSPFSFPFSLEWKSSTLSNKPVSRSC